MKVFFFPLICVGKLYKMRMSHLLRPLLVIYELGVIFSFGVHRMICSHFNKLWMSCVISGSLQGCRVGDSCKQRNSRRPWIRLFFSDCHISPWVPDGRCFSQHDTVMCESTTAKCFHGPCISVGECRAVVTSERH